MLKPNELEAVSMAYDKPMKELENRIMADIVRRIKINGEITRAADWQINRLYELGMTKTDIKKSIAESLNLSDEEMLEMYKKIVKSGYERDRNTYLKAGGNIIPFEENLGLQQLLDAVSEQTYGTLKNITGSLGFSVRNTSGKLEFKPLADYYQQTLDGAMLDIASGAFDYNTVLQRILSEMTNSGLRTVDYSTGWANRVDVAARRAIMTGMSQLTAKVSEDNAAALDTEYFEVSWHGGARPSHQKWQGKVYSKSQLVSICGLGEVTGLCGANCYHDYYPFIPGISERTYTDEELAKMNREENTPKEFAGKLYTKYEALQRQRRLETTMRAQKQKIALLESGGADEDTLTTAKVKYRTMSYEYTRFSKAMELPQQRERVRVSGEFVPKVGAKTGGKKVSANERLELLKNPLTSKAESGIISIKEKGVVPKINADEAYSELGKFKQRIISDERIDKEYYDALKEKFSHGSDTAKAVFNKFVPVNSVQNSTLEGVAHYDPNTKKISMHYGADLKNERGACATWFHEHGHLIDDFAGDLSDNDDFLKILRNDKVECEKRIIHEKGTRKVAETYKAIADELQDFRSQSGVSDIFNGLSAGLIKGCATHSDNYWNSLSVRQEAFAHMFEAQFDKIRYAEMKKYFPNALSYFENMLEGALK